MDSRAKLFGHSIHQQLVVLPLGMLVGAVAFDVAFLANGSGVMATVAFWMIVAGIIGGLAAAPFGWIDWLAIPRGARAKTIGLTHGLTNVVVLLLFALSAWLRWDGPERPEAAALAASFAGVILALFGGWLGGELVSRLAIGVYDGAHWNSPNSLSGRPAHEQSAKSR
ncbi:MAG: hypothetical protein DCC67_08950 [Planctomycetota bacterium]|nr:MAG: hypothetical protein DCC67_08950 [Planctomycetota bacterium]